MGKKRTDRQDLLPGTLDMLILKSLTRGLMRDGPFPVHYEPFEAPIANVIAPKIRGNPVARVFRGGQNSESPANPSIRSMVIG